MIALFLIVVILSVLSILAFFHYGRIGKCLEHEENLNAAMSEVLDRLESGCNSKNKVAAYKNVVQSDTLLKKLTASYGVAAVADATKTDIARLQNTILEHINRLEESLGEAHAFNFEKKDDSDEEEDDDSGMSDDSEEDE